MDRTWFVLSFITDTRRVSNLTIYISNITGTAYDSWAPWVHPRFWLGPYCSYLLWLVHYGLQLRFSMKSIFLSLHAEDFKIHLFSFDLAEMLLLFGTTRTASSPLGILICLDIFIFPHIYCMWKHQTCHTYLYRGSDKTFWSDSKSKIATLAFDWHRQALLFCSCTTAYKFIKLTRNSTQWSLKSLNIWPPS